MQVGATASLKVRMGFLAGSWLHLQLMHFFLVHIPMDQYINLRAWAGRGPGGMLCLRRCRPDHQL